jgi:hypothetical protein
MKDTIHYTDALGSMKSVAINEVKRHWIEYQLVDELGAPLADLPYRATNEAVRSGVVREYVGRSDGDGIIRIEGLHPIPLTLFISANPLAEMMQTRQLRAVRPEPRQPSFGSSAPLYGPQRSGFSPVEQEAVAAGHGYQYLRIGQLCDEVPVFDVPWEESDLPAYHFPDPRFRGFTLEFEALDQRNVIEVCPFRAWSLMLNHRGDYCLVNAYNLGLMSILAYTRKKSGAVGSVQQFFMQQCLDVSRTPRVWDDGQSWRVVVTDVPFDERYTWAVARDTSDLTPSHGNTQFFYAISNSQVLVGWRGTEIKIIDAVTDISFRPVRTAFDIGCEEKIACADLTAEGKVHVGFRDAYRLAKKYYGRDLKLNIELSAGSRDLYICGHSLGGALALIHSAVLAKYGPVLYTYGMPRTFTRKAVQEFSGIKHFRHVNDTDIVPRLPFEADFDGRLYNRYGRLGISIGIGWSMSKAALGSIFGHTDPFVHAGEIVMFYKAEQHLEIDNLSSDAPRKNSLFTRIAYSLPHKAKLYLVPSLSEVDNDLAEKAQYNLNTSFTPETRARFFPPNGNVRPAGSPLLSDHFMAQYQPYIHNQLLELLAPESMESRQAQRTRFELQMQENIQHIPPNEVVRDRAFLHLQSLVGLALKATFQADGGAEALERFKSVANPKAYYEKTLG